MIVISLINKQIIKEYPFGTPLATIAKAEKVELPFPLMGALVNNKVRDLNYRLHKPVTIEFFDMTSRFGIEIYYRSAFFILFKAVGEVLPGTRLKILHSISGGKYCEIDNLEQELTEEMITQLNQRIDEIVAADIPFVREEMFTQDALQEFRNHHLEAKAALLDKRGRMFTSVYRLDKYVNYYFGVLALSTGLIKVMKTELYENGLLLKLPSKTHPTSLGNSYKLPKLFAVYQTYKKWVMDIGVPYVKDINNKVDNGEIEQFIQISEAFHEKEIAKIADQIDLQKEVKIVLLSGPSSSGKTTTCRRLAVQLGVLGYYPLQISVDDFFLEREQTPLDENGEYNFETIDAIDLQLFNDTLNKLLAGEKVELPTFNFTTGKKEWKGKTIQMNERSILVIEGIHCLNPKLTNRVDESHKFKVFVSALTSVSIDSQNPIPTSDTRLIRRIIRDYKYRNYSALETIRRWQSVQTGEYKYIFPYQENADVMFNTSLVCELGVLKQYAVPILREVPETEHEYAEATRLLKFLSFFKTIPEFAIPGGSILREFVGGSTFHY
ncbi:MAG: nucleoside kinase [Bacteroidales bacterium]|jgi:uridine kinase|nr:nucleoside kinase [Bacteroidales bacterium]